MHLAFDVLSEHLTAATTDWEEVEDKPVALVLPAEEAAAAIDVLMALLTLEARWGGGCKADAVVDVGVEEEDVGLGEGVWNLVVLLEYKVGLKLEEVEGEEEVGDVLAKYCCDGVVCELRVVACVVVLGEVCVLGADA